ncbi:NTP transferase domain-containing protein [Holdemanella biformis]|uniref:NTP transferase domain-containing protein n=1 Tax=Holdemanella biformis TaxID=1735 RepID=UPI0029426FCD|nr:NTP transferase domain-containing protein [Holdemanella biformis]
MDNDKITVIICCAGMGTRLGIGSTKALITIDGVPLIIQILKLLKDYTDIRIVVGYQADKVIEVVNEYRKDIMFVFNYNFTNSGIVESFNKALPYGREYIVEIDGDLLINPEDFKKFMEFPDECLGINEINSDNPVFVNMMNQKIINFDNKKGNYEWTGLLKVKSNNLGKEGDYLYEILSTALPLKCLKVRAKDIDTFNDYEKAIDWYNNGMKE